MKGNIMKKSAIILALALGVSALSLTAQEQGGPPPPGERPPPPEGGMRGGPMHGPGGFHLLPPRAQEQLNLTDDQIGYIGCELTDIPMMKKVGFAVADEFRDGNVPAQKEPLRVARRAFQALPETVTEYYFRGDSACWEKGLLRWLRDERRADGPQGVITFGISVRMTPNLKQHIARLSESLWKPYREDAGVIAECADLLNYWPEEEERPEGAGPLRYVAIRMRKRQGELFADGSEVKHFAVRTNLWDWKPKRLLEWHREKAGTIEAVHDVLKNELAGGVLPCGRYGANAAWFRLAVITYNVLTAMKRLVLPPDLQTARPKRLRFLIFQQPGKLIQHARKTVLRLARTWNRFSNWKHAMEVLVLPAPA